jgi:hypothetical protein
MNKQASKNSSVYSSLISLTIAFPICAVIWIAMKIVWPILRFCAKLASKQIMKAMRKSKVAKPLKAALPTPAIFKDAPNLAPAKSIRF